jgi:hypothetical protein
MKASTADKVGSGVGAIVVVGGGEDVGTVGVGGKVEGDTVVGL